MELFRDSCRCKATPFIEGLQCFKSIKVQKTDLQH
nr:MAG TPA: hypothetical protein [Caudoviricetes sp.]